MDTMAVHYYCAWPLMLLEFAGVMAASPEGFYNEWYNTSVIVSLSSQSIIIFFNFSEVFLQSVNTHKNV